MATSNRTIRIVPEPRFKIAKKITWGTNRVAMTRLWLLRICLPWDEAPRHLIRDRDGAFGPAYTRRIRAMGIRDHPTAPRSPWQNGHAERLIGSIRRESLDHLVVFDDSHLRRVLKNYASYHNEVRTHLSLDKSAPGFRCPQKIGRIAAISILGGLHPQYVRV